MYCLSYSQLDDYYIEGATHKSGCHNFAKNYNYQLCSTAGALGIPIDAPGIVQWIGFAVNGERNWIL